MIFDTKKFFRDNRNVEIHIEQKNGWKLYKTISPKREIHTVEVKTWFGLFIQKIEYIHPTQTYEDTVDIAFDMCLRMKSNTKIVTKTIIWVEDKERFAYSGDLLVWSSEAGWIREY